MGILALDALQQNGLRRFNRFLALALTGLFAHRAIAPESELPFDELHQRFGKRNVHALYRGLLRLDFMPQKA